MYLIDTNVSEARRGTREAVRWLKAVDPEVIAATAIVHGLIIVTRNVADFADTRASVLNPWDGPAR